MSKELTPLMKQYWEIKALHKDKILFFRMGDFFEIFYDDAVLAAPLLGITLTQRNKKSEDTTPMCGMPHHSIANSINKLLSLGHRVALCDQIEDPKLAKGIVKRAVTRVLTPGMVFDTDQLKETESHYVGAFDTDSLALVDTTTGESFYFQPLSIKQRNQLLSILPVAEMVFKKDLNKPESENFKNQFPQITCSEFDFDNHSNIVNQNLPFSARLVESYILNLSPVEIKSILRPFEKRTLQGRMEIGFNSIKHLEIFSNYKGEEKGSLFSAINRTLTASGARKLRHWLRFPLVDSELILKRQSYIEFFREHLFELKKTREILPQMGDIERRLTKIAQPQRHGRDLTTLAHAVQAGLQALEISSSSLPLSENLNPQLLYSVSEQILNTIVQDAPLSVKNGHIIKKGVSSELDEIIDLSTNAQSLIQNLENQEKEKTGISSLKVRYNSVFGYYIEVTNTHKDKVPSYYQRKQTLSNAERYCTDELIELERKVLSAQTRRNDLEFSIFEELCRQILSLSAEFTTLASHCSEVDIYSSLAWLSLEENYCKPLFTTERQLELQESRHPVIEQFQKQQNKESFVRFVSNSVKLNQRECYLITGPNMAGKSTLMRQVALTAIMAQVGSYVPATFARLPIYDSVYTRIGASDQLTEGLSTFMVEMTETAEMLDKAGPHSLLILDEVGRGTATFDGLCLAQSILEYIINNLQSHVMFATHYHELVQLEKKYSEIKNVHMQIQEKNGQIEFCYLLSPGAALKSYGIQVADLAGLPKEVIRKAESLLKKYEGDLGVKPPNLEVKTKNTLDQLTLFQS